MRRTLLLALALCLLAGMAAAEDRLSPFRDPTPLETREIPAPDCTEVRRQYDGNSAALAALLDRIAGTRSAPCVHITTEDGAAILSGDAYVPCVVDVFNCDGAYRLTAEAGVKVRGNSTANGDEKPYRIRFSEKQGVLGLHGGARYRSWVLLRSQWNLVMDRTGFGLARAIFDGKYYVSDCAFVNLYINGDWAGIYLLCEQNQVAKGRIDVREPEEGETDFRTGYALELDNYPDDEHPHFKVYYAIAPVTDIAGTKRRTAPKFYSVKSDIRTVGQLRYIEAYVGGCYRLLTEATVSGRPVMLSETCGVVPAEGVYDTPREAVEAVLDADSLAECLILQELVHNYDVGEGNFYIAVDLAPGSRYPRLTFMAPWDFNWGYGDAPDGGYYACTFQPYAAASDRSNPWFIMAVKNEWFMDIVKARWRALSESGVLTEALAQVKRDCEALRGDLGADGWKIDCAADVIRFVEGRIAWLDEQWLERME